MHRIIILLMCVIVVPYARYDCDDCRRDTEQCKEWANDAIRQGRAPKYCDESRCDKICGEEYKKNNGITTDAEKYADQRFNSEMGLINSTAAYYASLNKKQKEVYDYVTEYLDRQYSKAYNFCYQKNAYMMGYDMNVDFAIKLCIIEQLDGISYEKNQSEFISLMNNLEIPKEYWKVANMSISNAAGKVAMQMY